MKVVQLVHTLSYGDAISSEVLALHNYFTSIGHESSIAALNIHPLYKSFVLRLTEGTSIPGSDEIILHYSLGSPLNDLYRSSSAQRKTLVYHNLTPARWFSGINPRIVKDIEHGVLELPELCKVSTRVISDSSYNASEIKKLGFHSEVLSLPLDPKKWGIEANEGIASLARGEGGVHLLHVGRIAPNKSIEDIIRTFYFLNRYWEKQSRLWLVGIDIDTELYSFALKKIIHELDIQDYVTFTGGLSDSEVKALYQSCTAYLCMSEHEGFCLPVVEAMYFGLPVISSAGTALGDTVGDGGVVVHEKKHPEIAALISELARNPTLRDSLVQRGKARAEHFSLERFYNEAGRFFGV